MSIHAYYPVLSMDVLRELDAAFQDGSPVLYLIKQTEIVRRVTWECL